MDTIATPELGWPSYQLQLVERWHTGEVAHGEDYVAEEVPVVLLYNGEPHVVMMATPLDLEEFALGFSITEELVRHREEIESIRVYPRSEGMEVRLRVTSTCEAIALEQKRNLTGRTGCGLCGAKTLQQAVRRPPPVSEGIQVVDQTLYNALNTLRERQKLNQITGALHAAAWVTEDRGIVLIREDVGRHNALDKLIGALFTQNMNICTGFVLVTSRASYEMVQKCATVGISFLAAISAPTALAIRLAETTRLTLIGFARGNDYVVYTHPHRVEHTK